MKSQSLQSHFVEEEKMYIIFSTRKGEEKILGRTEEFAEAAFAAYHARRAGEAADFRLEVKAE